MVELARIVQRTGGGQDVVREHVTRAWKIYEAGGSPAADELREWLDGLGGPAGQ